MTQPPWGADQGDDPASSWPGGPPPGSYGPGQQAPWPGYGPPPGQGPLGQWGPPMPPVPPAPTSERATWAVILGVGSIFCCGLFTGIPAIVLGISARRQVRESGGRLEGDGLAVAGIVTGIVGTLLSLVLAVLLVGLIGFGNVAFTTYQESCQDVAPSPTVPGLHRDVVLADCP